MRRSVIVEGDTCWRVAACDEARVLVDARDYYAAFCRAALRAERSILMSGWQFDTRMELLRGADAERAAHPVEFIPFLNFLCERAPSLTVKVMAWDYSTIYALEREWMQRWRFEARSHPRVEFAFLAHPVAGGSHHQKYVVIDGAVAFAGGLDICDARWDSPSHAAHDPDRRDAAGDPAKPFHDVQAALVGEAARALEEMFAAQWQTASGAPLDLPPAPRERPAWARLSALSEDRGHALPVSSVALSRSELCEGREGVCEVKSLFEAAIAEAERLVYIENQYFTSRAMLRALAARMRDRSKPKLTVVLVMPDGGDSPKEDFVLGDRQRAVRSALSKIAEREGHALRVLMSVDRSEPERPVPTFIHAKVLIVDDELLSVGSANLTNRSMEVDTELNTSWQAEAGEAGEALRGAIRSLRGALLAEHTGRLDGAEFEPVEGLAGVIDAVCDDPTTKLKCQEIVEPEDGDPFLISIFDPSGEITFDALYEALSGDIDVHDGLLRKGARKVGQRLGVVDID